MVPATTRRRKAGRADWGKVRRLPSGRYQASYLGPDARRHNAPMTFTAETDARGWLAGQRHAIETGKWTPRTATADADAQADRARTLDEYAREWIAHRTGHDGAPLRDTTRHGYLALLDGPLEPLASTPVIEVSPARVRS